MKRSRFVALATSVALTLTGIGVSVPAAMAADSTTNNGLLAWYKLDETAGTVVTDSSGNGRTATVTGTASWNGGDGFTFSGGAASAGNAINLPNNLLTGKDDVTIDFDVLVDSTLTGNYFMFNFGNIAGSTGATGNDTGYLFVTGKDSSSRLRGSLASGNWSTEQNAYRAGGLTTNIWKHVTLVVDGGTVAAPGSLTLYEDGIEVAKNTSLTISPKDIGNGVTTRNVLGRSAYAADGSFKGKIRDFRVYDRTLTSAESLELAGDVIAPGVSADTAALTLGDTSAVSTDLVLPTAGTNGSTITWVSSAPDVVSSTGKVVLLQDPQTVTLTATVSRSGVSQTKEFTVRTVAGADDLETAAADAAALVVTNLGDARGNLTLPTKGAAGSTVTWDSSAPSVITTTGEVTRPAPGAAAAVVTLTATVARGGRSVTRAFEATVPASDAPAEKTAYFFPYFTGEVAGGESIRFGVSKGNDALHWDELNDGKAVLTSEYGEKGLRDPFIIRSPEGDKFYLLATDLKIYPSSSFTIAQQTGSLYLEIWESTDLVNWSAQRHIKVSSGYAGNTWAPEAYYDEDLGSYVVYWASNLYPSTTTAGRTAASSYNRMMYVTTRDFVTFTEPQTWIDVSRGAGKGMIDSTVIKDSGTYYRFTKDEASMTVRQEKSSDLLARVSGSLPTTSAASGWKLIKEKVGVGEPNSWGGTFTAGEGPTVFSANPGDVNTNGVPTWFLFMDQPSYHGGKGYVPFATTDLESGTWTSVANKAALPTSPRHGTVLPLTQAEYERVLEAYQPNLLLKSVDAVSVTTRQGVAPVLPATVQAHFADGSTRAVAVTWPVVTEEQYSTVGTSVISAAVVAGSSIEATATMTVTDLVDPTVTLATDPVSPDGAAGWWISEEVSVLATGSDDNLVTSVELSVDGGVWRSFEGAQGSVLVAGDGVHVVRARATDSSGNISEVVDREVRVDSGAPVSQAQTDKAARTVSLQAADEWSGVDRIEWRTGSGEWSTYAAPVVVGSGAVTVEYRAVDRAGNVEEVNSVDVLKAGVTLKASAVAATVAGSTYAFGSAATVRVTVVGAAGTPTGVVRVMDGSRQVASGTLSGGRVNVVLPKTLAVGSKTLSVVYVGDAAFAGSSGSVKVTVVKASSTTGVKVSASKVKTTVNAQAAVTVKSGAGVSVAGPVSVTITKKVSGVTKTVWTKATKVSSTGAVSVKLPKLSAGSYTVRVAYAGSSTVKASSVATTLTVTK